MQIQGQPLWMRNSITKNLIRDNSALEKLKVAMEKREKKVSTADNMKFEHQRKNLAVEAKNAEIRNVDPLDANAKVVRQVMDDLLEEQIRFAKQLEWEKQRYEDSIEKVETLETIVDGTADFKKLLENPLTQDEYLETPQFSKTRDLNGQETEYRVDYTMLDNMWRNEEQKKLQEASARELSSITKWLEDTPNRIQGISMIHKATVYDIMERLPEGVEMDNYFSIDENVLSQAGKIQPGDHESTLELLNQMIEQQKSILKQFENQYATVIARLENGSMNKRI